MSSRRSSSTAIYDLERDAGVAIFGGIRPGCWINMIPASGLVLVPEASVGCTCSFPLRCSYALVNKPDRAQPWTVFVNHTEFNKKGQVVPDTFGKPVQHLGVNFGAPADMKDENGTLWLAYPNPRTVYSQNHFAHYGIKFDLKEQIAPDMGYFCHDFKGVHIAGTQAPWLFTSGCLGLLRCEIPVLDQGSNGAPGVYTVRLGFRSRRISAGTDKAVVREFKDVAVKGNLLLELVPKAATPSEKEAPLIHFVEIIRQQDRALAMNDG